MEGCEDGIESDQSSTQLIQLLFPPVNEELVQTGVDEVGNQRTVVSTNLHIHRSQGKTTSSESSSPTLSSFVA